MHFAEIQDFAGRWRPVTFPDKPKLQDGRLRVSDGARGRIRALVAIPPHRQHLPLSELQRLYGVRPTDEDQTAAVDAIDDAEVVGEPVFRSGRGG